MSRVLVIALFVLLAVNTVECNREGVPVVGMVSIPDHVRCSPKMVSVSIAWTTMNVETVYFRVNGNPVGSDQPPSGNTALSLPCDGGTHEIVIVGKGRKKETAVARHVRTVTG